MYGDFDELAESAAAYFAAGLERGDVCIVVARAENSAAILERLRAAGWDEERVGGSLVTADAQETLSSFMADGRPDAERFEQAVGGLLDEAARRRPGANLRAFGEMVDILWEQGEHDAAVELERVWNELAEKRDF